MDGFSRHATIHTCLSKSFVSESSNLAQKAYSFDAPSTAYALARHASVMSIACFARPRAAACELCCHTYPSRLISQWAYVLAYWVCFSAVAPCERPPIIYHRPPRVYKLTYVELKLTKAPQSLIQWQKPKHSKQNKQHMRNH